MELKGKGFFINDVTAIEGGNPESIAALAEKSRSSFLIIKIADGIQARNVKPDLDSLSRLISILRSRNIIPWGWQYIYGKQPEDEARTAIKQVEKNGLDGLVIFTGNDYQAHNGYISATKYMTAVRQNLAHFPIALSAFKFPARRSSFPWQPFLEKCDLVMPQVFWTHSHGTSKNYLLRSFQEYKEITLDTHFCPIMPTFKTWGWVPYAEEFQFFHTAAVELQLTAISYFSLDTARQVLLKDIWQEIEAEPFFKPGNSATLADVLAASLDAQDLSGLLSLYDNDAILLHDSHVFRGRHQIEKYYQDLFGTNSSQKIILDNQQVVEDGLNVRWHSYGINTQTIPHVINTHLKLSGSKITEHYQYSEPSY